MTTKAKTTPWRATARFRMPGKTRIRDMVVEITYAIRETRRYRGKIQVRLREEKHYISGGYLNRSFLLIKAVSDFIPSIEVEAFEVHERQQGLELVRTDISGRVRRISSPKNTLRPKTPLGKALLGPDPFVDLDPPRSQNPKGKV